MLAYSYVRYPRWSPVLLTELNFGLPSSHRMLLSRNRPPSPYRCRQRSSSQRDGSVSSSTLGAIKLRYTLSVLPPQPLRPPRGLLLAPVSSIKCSIRCASAVSVRLRDWGALKKRLRTPRSSTSARYVSQQLEK
ncbi:hypothetical protein BAUCODRAFT_477544 [Baudoinia panamericana UAMH 10762]|uniref:Uncharacterized protein n=1 Tax=Baudoinia panamericana (strain UAMH 10762) TaxID=717646 RepID=M2MIM8_BAUPA|nr:uncharacterized protein BAUCODRAFT_477544 [Baudoinia panamericana UAMH 10762]EMC96501.1 hypothetical protein BAUCODRAFT_477544 [Baudoinia panamericana UAMH 10762]